MTPARCIEHPCGLLYWFARVNDVLVSFTTTDLDLVLFVRPFCGPGFHGAELVDQHGNVCAVSYVPTGYWPLGTAL